MLLAAIPYMCSDHQMLLDTIHMAELIVKLYCDKHKGNWTWKGRLHFSVPIFYIQELVQNKDMHTYREK